jgi:hypothetical protein
MTKFTWAWTSCLFLNIVRVINMNVYIDMEKDWDMGKDKNADSWTQM